MVFQSEFCQFEQNGMRCTTYRHPGNPDAHQLSPVGSLMVQKIKAQEERDQDSINKNPPADENWDPTAEPLDEPAEEPVALVNTTVPETQNDIQRNRANASAVDGAPSAQESS